MQYSESEIMKAVDILKTKYGIIGIDNKYMLATDIDGDLRIAAIGLYDLFLKKQGFVNPGSFIKIKDLIN